MVLSLIDKITIFVYIIGIILFPVIVGFFESKKSSMWENIFDYGVPTLILAFFWPLVFAAACLFLCIGAIISIFGFLGYVLICVGMTLRAVFDKQKEKLQQKIK